MDAEKEDTAIRVKNVLGSIAVMDIPIHDRHAFDSKPPPRVPGGDRDVVHDAKSHSATRRRVVARRADQAERRLVFARHHPRPAHVPPARDEWRQVVAEEALAEALVRQVQEL